MLTLIAQMMEMLKAVLEQDDLFDLQAKVYRKAVDSLTRNGFPYDDAVKIVAGQGLGLKGV